jgi:arabinofuranosyltransferase
MNPPSPENASAPHWQQIPVRRLALPIALYALVVLQSAWLHEDAYITYRTIDNFVHGYGATWNIGERVQTYTHPLWFLAMSVAHFLTGEIFYTSTFFSWACSLAAVLVLALWVAPSAKNASYGIALLCSCKAFVDYSTSGLENPLSHLLLALFVGCYLRAQPAPRSLAILALIAGLATLNRIDTLLVYLPALGWRTWQMRDHRALGALAMGFAPFVAWELFSLLYYGFPFPNTAYGKLNTGTPATALALQGLYYLHNSWKVDPLALTAVGLGAAWLLYKKKWSQLPLVLGPILYLAYTVKIGGDYMSGRFIALPFFGAALLIAHNIRFPTTTSWGIALVALLLIGLTSPFAPLRSGLDYGERGAEGSHHIVDERGNYYASTGLLKALTSKSETPYPRHAWVGLGRTMAKKSQAEELVISTYINLGILGYYAGRKVHHLDVLGIADPLLARLPAFADPNWAPGHFARIVPEGYIETHLYGHNLIADQQLATYYATLCAVTQGALFDGDRWLEIWRLNTGYYAHLIDREKYRHPAPEELQRSQASLTPPIKLRPDAATRSIEAGNIYFAQRHFPRAIAAYKEAIRLRPDQPSPYHNLGAAWFAAGDQHQALTAWQRAVELGSQLGETYRALIWLLRKRGEEDQARQVYRLAEEHLQNAADRAALAEIWREGQ